MYAVLLGSWSLSSITWPGIGKSIAGGQAT